jgi:arylsulfatase A-like enzyme
MKNYNLAILVAITAAITLIPPAHAQDRGPISSPPGTSATATVTPQPGQAPFNGVIGPTVAESVPYWTPQPRAPIGAPNVLFVLLDDFGFSQLGCYGGQGLKTPNIDKLAAGGLRYNNFHVTPLCSPTRAAFLTGRNHHSNALGTIAEFSTGFPGYNGRMPLSRGMISEILAPAGYSTFCVGKWHLTPPEDANLGANRRWWPLGRGFDRYYGFLGGTTSEFIPWIAHDNHYIQPPGTPEEGYHFLTDMTDKAREFIIDVEHVAPDRPFFMYYCPGGVRAPQHVPQEWIDQYDGVFDKGWDHYREETLKKQIAIGICPPGTKLAPRDPSIPVWDELSDRHREVFTRQMEVFAAHVSFIDDSVGRLVDFIDQLGDLDNTLIVVTSDNGASIEGGDNGVPNEMMFFNNIPVPLEMAAADLDKWGGPDSFPAYAAGWAWAGNTPFLRWKRDTTRGGTATPLIIHWPKKIKAKGEIRTQFTHAIDVVPTVLELLDMESPAAINGVTQAPMEGISFASTFDEPDTKLTRGPQYFEMVGRRAVYHDGWRAYSPWKFGKEMTPETLAESKWMLFNINEDFSESTDVAGEHPEKLAELERMWWIEAARYDVLPLDGRSVIRAMEPRPTMSEPRTKFTYYSGGGEVGAAAANVFNRSHSITATVTIPEGGAEGVLLAQGGQFAGYSFYLKDKKLHYTHNYVGLEEYTLTSEKDIPAGETILRYEFEVTGPPDIPAGKGASGIGRLFIGDWKVAEKEIPVTVPISFALSGEGLCCGWDSLSPASTSYESPFRFTGSIKNVVVDTGE